ncbi:MAG: 5-deoxy-glucuronate isomerase, partial [Anaerolineae bacterium]|nr:5-deoxy-glucuronate isomerase [Anaerolineae bacterium]
MQYTPENMLVRPTSDPADPGLILSVTPDQAGWDYISFQVRQLAAGATWSFSSGDNELALVILTGSIAVESNRGEWRGLERE